MSASRRDLTVLLAEDDASDAFLMQRAFDRVCRTGRLIVVPDGQEAVAYLQGEGQFSDRLLWPLPDVLILDQWMPGLSGLEVLCWVRTDGRLARLPVIILSGTVSPDDAASAVQLKAVCRDKGADLETLVRAIESSMEEMGDPGQARNGEIRDAQECTVEVALAG